MEKVEKYIQVGVTALRDPVTREFLPAVPLYIKAEDGAEKAEEKLVKDLGNLFARQIKQYMDKCEAAGVGLCV